MAVPQGIATIALNESNYLTNFNSNAVVGLGSETLWKIQVVGEPDSENPENTEYTIKIHNDSGGPEQALTLDPETNNILVSQLQSPAAREQLWTFHDVIILKRFPPIAHCRIQSVEDNQRWASLGDPLPLPRLYLNVGGVLRDELGDRKWIFDYTETE